MASEKWPGPFGEPFDYSALKITDAQLKEAEQRVLRLASAGRELLRLRGETLKLIEKDFTEILVDSLGLDLPDLVSNAISNAIVPSGFLNAVSGLIGGAKSVLRGVIRSAVKTAIDTALNNILINEINKEFNHSWVVLKSRKLFQGNPRERETVSILRRLKST